MFLLKLGHSSQGLEIMYNWEPSLKGASLFMNMKVLSYVNQLISIIFFFLFCSLEAENNRLSQQLLHCSAQNSYNLRPHEEMELLRAQVRHKKCLHKPSR